MGLFFTLFYIFTALIGPQVLFGDLAQYHIEILIVLMALFCSAPSLQDSNLLGIPQTYGVLGLTVGVMLSLVFNGWIGGAPGVFMEFAPSAVAFFLVLLNCKKKSHLQILTVVLLAAALYTIYRGYQAESARVDLSMYVMTMKNNNGDSFYRIRGADFLNDPNDFAQFMMGLIPCVFLFWGKGKSVRNLFLVFLPISLLLIGMYLTHSRGGMIAMMVAAAVAGRRKFGVVRSLIVGAVLYVAISAAGFSGGRDTSVDAGEDRLEAWAAGLGMIRAHPLFGVGYNRFTDFHEITAHNTVVLCAAELGLFGFFFWLLCVLPTVRDSYVTSAASRDGRNKKVVKVGRGPPYSSGPPEPVVSKQHAAAPVPAVAETRAPAVSGRPNFLNPIQNDSIPDAEILRMAELSLISLSGFLMAGWFLARAYTMVLFVYVGIAAAVYKMACDRKIAPRPLPMARAAKFCAIAGVVLIGVVWMTLRASHL